MARFKTELPLLILLVAGCAKDKGRINYPDNYPLPVSHIISTKCATSGCHNSQSKDAAAGLSLSTWEELFNGGRSGPAVIPFRPDFSTLCFFSNKFPELGPVLNPQMPYGKEALTREEYLVLRDWVLAGAPDREGNLRTRLNNPSQKIYVTNQLCDVVTVLDARTKMPLRYVDVGNQSQTEFPYSVKVAPNNAFWLVAFFTPSGLVQKFDASTDGLTGQLNLGTGSWCTFDISADSQQAYFVRSGNPGKLCCVDLLQMKVTSTFTFDLVNPKGIACNDKNKTLCVGSEYGNYVYIIDISDPLHPLLSQRVIDGSGIVREDYTLAPHHLQLSGDGLSCFLSCEASGEIRRVNSSGEVTGSARLPGNPAMLALSKKTSRLFVSCPFDSVSVPGNIGSVSVLDATTLSLIKVIATGFQPYGLTVNEDDQTVTVVNANIRSTGPAPHHVSGCGGRNGYLTVIDMKTLNLVPGKRYELAVYPFDAAIKVK